MGEQDPTAFLLEQVLSVCQTQHVLFPYTVLRRECRSVDYKQRTARCVLRVELASIHTHADNMYDEIFPQSSK